MIFVAFTVLPAVPVHKQTILCVEVVMMAPVITIINPNAQSPENAPVISPRGPIVSNKLFVNEMIHGSFMVSVKIICGCFETEASKKSLNDFLRVQGAKLYGAGGKEERICAVESPGALTRRSFMCCFKTSHGQRR